MNNFFLDNDEFAVEYIRNLINEGKLDLSGEHLRSVYRKGDDGYSLIFNNENASPSCSNVLVNHGDKVMWTSNVIKLLITERLGKEKIFSHPTCRKSKLWDDIARKIRETTGLNINGTECNNKFRNLLQTYRVNKNKSSHTGEEAIRWEYYHLFDKVLGSKASSRPLTNMIADSLDTRSDEVNDTSDEMDSNSQGSSSHTTVRRKKHVKEELRVGHYLFLKYRKIEETSRTQQERFEAKCQLKLKEIDAINNLAEAIKSIAESTKK